MAKFSKEEILMGRIALADLPQTHRANLATLMDRLCEFFADFQGPIAVTSGYRPPAVNAAIGGAAQSHHMACAAADLADPSGKVWQYCLANLDKAKRLGLWFEDKRWTATWIHCQIVAPKSGKRIFVPNAKPPAAPGAWNGQYDSKFD